MTIVLIVIFLFLCLIGALVYFLGSAPDVYPRLQRWAENPVLAPNPDHWWESEAVFNPGAFYKDGKVHLFYRALGRDGISRIGYAWSKDGIHFNRFPQPVYEITPEKKERLKKLSYETLHYNRDIFASGGGWGGAEDPRIILMGNQLYMSFSIFEGWHSIRMGLTSLPLEDLELQLWKWSPHILMSPEQQTNKNWVLFPEKIHGKFAVLHALTPKIMIDYVDKLEDLHDHPIESNNQRSGRKGRWDEFVRGASAPPIKTPVGWLLFYHGSRIGDPVGYKVGAMLLDLDDPTRIRYRSAEPILEPEQWYENDWKPGVVYASAAVIMGDDLIVYYGGGDKYVAAARLPIKDFLHKLTQHTHKVA